MQDENTRLGSCVACQIGVEVQPLPAQQQCARCDAKDRIPVDCGLPSKIQVYKGYYRPDGVPPTVSLVSRDGSASDDAGVSAPPVMAVACPWGTKACAGGALHGNASCVPGHHGYFCAQCWTGWYRSAKECLECPQVRARVRARVWVRVSLTLSLSLALTL